MRRGGLLWLFVALVAVAASDSGSPGALLQTLRGSGPPPPPTPADAPLSNVVEKKAPETQTPNVEATPKDSSPKTAQIPKANAYASTQGDEPRIFVYPLPSKFNTDWSLKDHTNSEMVEFEVAFDKMIRTSPYRTTDIHKATHFYVPVYAVSYCAAQKAVDGSLGCTRSRDFLADAIKFVKSNFNDYWTRKEGADHLVLAAYDWGTCYTTFEKDAREQGRPAFLEKARTIGFLGSWHDNPGNCYSSQDITMPAYVSRDSRMALAGSGVSEKKSTLMFFRGDRVTNPVRAKILETYAEDSSSIVSDKRVPLQQFAKEMKGSEFCLVPPGFAPWSFRSSEAVLAGCLPVVPGTSEDTAHPCSPMVDHDAFTVYTGGEVSKIKSHVLAARSDEAFMKTARVKLEEAKPFYEYGPATMDCFVRQLVK